MSEEVNQCEPRVARLHCTVYLSEGDGDVFPECSPVSMRVHIHVEETIAT